MDPCSLGKDVVAHNGLVRRNADAGKGRYQLAYLVKGALVHAYGHLGHKIVDHGNHTGQGGIPGPFAHGVHTGVDAAGAGHTITWVPAANELLLVGGTVKNLDEHVKAAQKQLAAVEMSKKRRGKS